MTQPLSDKAKELAAGYVLGELAPEEEQELQQLLRQNPALTQEVQALSAVFRLMPQALPKVEPPAELRSRLLTAHAVAEADPAASSPALDSLDMLQERRSLQRWSAAGRGSTVFQWRTLGAVAAGLAVLALGLDNLRLRQQISRDRAVDSKAIAALLQRPNSRLVSLQNRAIAATGTVLFTPGQWDEVVVSLERLPALPPDQTYRMWLRLQDGTLILCGEFVPNSQGAVFARLTPPQQPTEGNKAASVFITAEPKNSPTQPQGSPVVATEL